MARIGWEVTGSMFSGLIPAMITPFDEGGEVDLRATEAVVEHFVGAGVDGISALGSTGEFSHLTLDERKSCRGGRRNSKRKNLPPNRRGCARYPGGHRACPPRRRDRCGWCPRRLALLLEGGRRGTLSALCRRVRSCRGADSCLQSPFADRHRPLAGAPGENRWRVLERNRFERYGHGVRS